jgi:DNA invertase Pin-like site-specific DNA recombinase
MPDGRFIAYFRVSTDRQGRSGLGLDAQRTAVAGYLNGGSWKLLAEFTEIESGKNNDRPQLEAALARCRLTGATLVIAKLDRLSRNAHFLLGLRDGNVPFVAADMPDANSLTVGILAVVAQAEREAISIRTRAALAESKKRLGGWRNGPKVDGSLGRAAQKKAAATFAASVGPMAAAMRQNGSSLRQIAAALTAQGIRTPRGGEWSAAAVNGILARFAG